MNKLFCDVLICGAGIIGSSLALKLAQFGMKVIIINDKCPVISKDNNVPSVRVSAINYTSVEFFKNINVWKDIPDQFCTPYYCMKTWEWSSAMVTFCAKSIGLSEMGYIIENSRLQVSLWKNIMDSELIQLYCPCMLLSLEYHKTFWKCILDQNIIINSQLLVGADGVNSQIRKILGIGVSGWRYRQCCMLLTIKTEKNISGTIWQIFTPTGPIGFLPLHDNWGSLMWFDTPEYINKLKNLPKLILEQKIKNRFYEQLGKITLYNKYSIPLTYQQANRYITLGGVLIGDAAHAIHPLAGQGINLGIRDVISLSNTLIDLDIFNTKKTFSAEILESYQKNRQRDVYIMQSSINCLYLIFHNNFFPLKVTRNIAFMTIEKCSFLKNRILRYAVLGV